MTHSQKRIHRINWIMARVDFAMREGLTIDEEKLISEACLFFGAGRRYVKEYLKDLEGANKIVRIDGKIWTPAHYEAEQILNSTNKEQKEE